MLTFKEARSQLEPHRKMADSECFHSEFDRLIEKRLDELDPSFMKKMRDYYRRSKMSRWFA